MADTDVAGPSRRGRYAKSTARRRVIVDAAVAAFAARGYRATSLREVAAAAGISLSTLTHHFPTKSALLLAALRRRDEMGSSPPQPERTDANGPRPRAVGLREQLVDQARRNQDVRGLVELYTVLCAEATTPEHPAAGYFLARFTTLRADLTRDLADLAARGRLRPGLDPAAVAISLVALWDGLQLQWLHDPNGVDVATRLGEFLDLLTVDDPPRAGAD